MKKLIFLFVLLPVVALAQLPQNVVNFSGSGVYFADMAYTIKWKPNDGDNLDKLRIKYWDQNSGGWVVIADNQFEIVLNNQYTWTIPDSLVSNSLLVKVEDQYTGEIFFESKAYNTILPDPFPKISPEIAMEEPEFYIFPNPSTGQISLNENPDLIETLFIFDIHGRQVTEFSGSHISSMDMSLYPPGSYLAVLKYKEEKPVKTAKFSLSR